MRASTSGTGRPTVSRKLTRVRDERGTVLVQVALFLTVWSVLAALSLDLARVRAAREAMQNALDHAAVEGLRQRDASDDATRRQAAARAVRLAFDPDLVEGAANPQPPLGAGAIVDVAERGGVAGAGGFDASTLRFWRPRPQANGPNAAHGDFVAGTFTPSLGTPLETRLYGRADFEPVPAADAGTAPAFLARLRRTRPDQPLDRIPGVSSAGPTVSMLFGFGSTLQADPSSGFDVKRDGITVRATSIASASRALAVSLGPPGAGLLEVGRGPVQALSPALDADAWNALPIGAAFTFTVDDLGVVRRASDGDPVGRLWGTADGLAVADAALPDALPRPGALGIELNATDAAPSEASIRSLAVQRAAPDGQLELIGFVAVQVTAVDTLWTVTPLGERIGASRASARVPTAWLALEPGGPLERPGLATAHLALQGALLAPSLAR